MPSTVHHVRGPSGAMVEVCVPGDDATQEGATVNLYALTNDRARLEVKSATVRNDPELARLIARTWEAEGFRVVVIPQD